MRSITKYGIFFVGALSLLTLNVSALSNPSNDSIKLENNSNEITGFGADVNFIHYTHEELSKYSDTIVIGTVKEILPSKWNTANGKQPNKPLSEIDHLNDTIYTDIVIGVDEYLKNPLSSNEVIVRSIVGTVGNISMTSDAEPSFKTGEKVLLYLSKDDNPSTRDIGPEHFIVTDYYEGKFTLTDDGKAIGHVENTTLDELLSTINQTDKKTNASFISSFWALAAVIGAVSYVRKTK